MTRASIDKMKLAELKLTCRDLGLEVTGRRKAPYQEALRAFVEERGETAEVLQGPQTAVKVGSNELVLSVWPELFVIWFAAYTSTGHCTP